MPPNISVSIYRIIQEGVQNILKHAQATRFSINISISQGKMELVINDNGIGNTQSIVEGIDQWHQEKSASTWWYIFHTE